MPIMMPYRFSYPLYLDLNDHHLNGQTINNKQFQMMNTREQHSLIANAHANFQNYQKDDNSSASNSNLIGLNAIYDNVLASCHPALAFLNARSQGLPIHSSSSDSLNEMSKKLSPTSSITSTSSLPLIKSPSFSIDSILGIRQNAHSNHAYLLSGDVDAEYDAMDFIKSRRNVDQHLSAIGNEAEKKAEKESAFIYKRSNIVSSVSPDSTAKDQTTSTNKHHNKNKLHSFEAINSSSCVSLKRDITCMEKNNLVQANKCPKLSSSSSDTTDYSPRQTQSQLNAISSGHKNHSNGQQINSNNFNTSTCTKSEMRIKRIRTIFSPDQLEKLEREFERQQYMVGPERLYLASSLNLSEAQVKVWFQNRRIKHRKQFFEKEQALIAKLRTRNDDINDDATIKEDVDGSDNDCSSVGENDSL